MLLLSAKNKLHLTDAVLWWAVAHSNTGRGVSYIASTLRPPAINTGIRLLSCIIASIVTEADQTVKP
jgi:hypothetical protein